MAENQYPYGEHMHEANEYIDNINEIVKMRYIDMEDSFILSFLYILSIDEQLHKKSDTIYAEIKRNYDMTIDQFENSES